MYLGLGLLMLWFVTVCGLALTIRRAHVHETDMLARPAAIWGHSPGPTFTVTGGWPGVEAQAFEVNVRERFCWSECDEKVPSSTGLSSRWRRSPSASRHRPPCRKRRPVPRALNMTSRPIWVERALFPRGKVQMLIDSPCRKHLKHFELSCLSGLNASKYFPRSDWLSVEGTAASLAGWQGPNRSWDQSVSAGVRKSWLLVGQSGWSLP
jgi:hypothetical protein